MDFAIGYELRGDLANKTRLHYRSLQNLRYVNDAVRVTSATSARACFLAGFNGREMKDHFLYIMTFTRSQGFSQKL